MAGRNVGVIGLGAMGLGVARSLLRAGFATHACDMRKDVLDAFAAEGGIAHLTPAALARACEVVAILVVNTDQSESVLFGASGAAQALARGSVVIMSVTVPPDFAERLGTRLAERGVLMLDAPVSGGAAKAATGEMTIMASGAPEAFAACEDVLAAIASKVYRLGDVPGTGSKVKMINQLLAGVHIAAMAEALALGIRSGADPRVLYEVIANSAGSSWMFQNRAPHILVGNYTPLSAVNIFVKDLGIVLDSARKLTFPLPLTAAAHQMFLATSAHGHGGEDDAAVIKMFAALTGIELPPSQA
ncbi:MAG TPA: L-threonate dehydrogenase [Burkholderiales bacterium]|nr:L-threonate dehydrogenase [Burkholderiales bacterium]